MSDFVEVELRGVKLAVPKEHPRIRWFYEPKRPFFMGKRGEISFCSLHDCELQDLAAHMFTFWLQKCFDAMTGDYGDEWKQWFDFGRAWARAGGLGK